VPAGPRSVTIKGLEARVRGAAAPAQAGIAIDGERVMELRFRTVRTALGYVGFVASPRGLRWVYLPQRDPARLRDMIRKDAPTAIEDHHLLPRLADALCRYFAGEPVEFDVPLDWRGRPSFLVDAWQACRRIGYGQTCSYKWLAEQLGRPGGARAVGMAMRRNPCPIVVPCHRVVRSDGRLGGFSGAGGTAFKRRLLQMEAAHEPVGVAVSSPR